MGSTEDVDRKRRHLGSHGLQPPIKKQAVQANSDVSVDKKVDPAVLQYQNARLGQQLEVQRAEIAGLEKKCSQLRAKQSSFDDTLIIINRVWTQLADDLELLAVRANCGASGLRVLKAQPAGPPNHGAEPGSCAVPLEQTFLYRLVENRGGLEVEPAGPSGDGEWLADNGDGAGGGTQLLEAKLRSRAGATIKALRRVVERIDAQRDRTDSVLAALRQQLPDDEAGHLLKSVDDDLRGELSSSRAAMDALHLRHREMAASLAQLQDQRAKDQANIRHLNNDLEETTLELEQVRRKLATLRAQQTGGAGGMAVSASFNGVQGGAVKAEPVDKGGCSTECKNCVADGTPGAAGGPSSKEMKEMQASLEEAKVLAARRLQELDASQVERNQLVQQVQQAEVSGADAKVVKGSKVYQALQDEAAAVRSELDRARSHIESMQREREILILREKEAQFRAEAADGLRRGVALAEARATELETKLTRVAAERDALQGELDHAALVAGRKETVAELKVMVNTLNKELSMVQEQLLKFKERAEGGHLLKAQVCSLNKSLQEKERECERLRAKCSGVEAELAASKRQIEELGESEEEISLFFEAYERLAGEPREAEAQARALAEVERLRMDREAHALEARVKASRKAEAACAAGRETAEAESAQLRGRLEAVERTVVELEEALKSKNEEGEAYISEIETIGQAYEDMQMQNQKLLQQITERDEYNTQLMAESVKARQLQASLQTEKEAVATRSQHHREALDVQKQRISQLEAQAKSFLEQLNKATEDIRASANALEGARRRVGEADWEAAAARAVAEGAQKTAEESGRRLAALAGELDQERYKLRRAAEERDALSAKLTKLGLAHDKGGASEVMQAEIEGYKKMLICSVCNVRPKDVVISKCYHLFCKPCIDRNLEIRLRKCPGCGTPFGQNDVHTVYL